LNPFISAETKQFIYDLPDERIARFPVKERDHSLLLVRKKDGGLFKDTFRHLADYLDDGCHLVFNNSRVIPARLVFVKPTGAYIELFCCRPVEPADYARSLFTAKFVIWECLAGNLKRFKGNSLSRKVRIKNTEINLVAEKVSQTGNVLLIKFSWNNDSINFAEILDEIGQIPLPPYIKRNPEEIDRFRYQTIYSKFEGSVAAPTAGLHFTEEVFGQLSRRHISHSEITLHIGAGTFQPIKAASYSDHDMHAEYFYVSGNMIRKLAVLNSKVVAVGTTTVRTLETIYWLGVKILHDQKLLPQEMHLGQWEAYQLPQNIPLKQSIEALGRWMEETNLSEFMTYTKLMIVPGYKFRMVNTLITNFHQPGSTLLLLVAAFIGDSWKDLYSYALNNGFRFLSYGDSSLLFC
jgi:S-adenosylmethionine:tRNA ribosyltransferase-isomerase